MTARQIGDRLAHYEILSPIGAGAMGQVFRARDTRLRRDVAIKVIAPDRAGDPEMRARFQREARAVAALNHPGIVAIHELGTAGEELFIVMELLEGTSLRTELAAGALPCRTAIQIAGQAVDALAAAHATGIVHRDLKPENVIVTRSGSVKILDFGLAHRAPVLNETTEPTLTVPHMLIGTLRYMAPEQARGETPTSASDLFAAGLLLYELITGTHPFDVCSVVGLLHAVLHDEPMTPSELNPAVPAALDALTLQMLAKDPALRPTAAEAVARLREIAAAGEVAVFRPPATTVRCHTVGREVERQALNEAWSDACAGRSRVVNIAGEPGIGKTTLVERFLADVAQSAVPCLVGRGRCSETLAATEAYLPILEALETLVRVGGDATLRALKRLAPTWHLQLAPVSVDDPPAQDMRGENRPASPQGVLRELRAFLHAQSRRAAVVLFLDDVHWADPATVDLLAYLARGLEGMRLLVVTTHRVSELLLAAHPMASLLLDLQARGIARELSLPFLERADVEQYLELEFAGHAFPETFVTLVHTRTEGNPLFMVDMLADLRNRGVIRRDDGWRLAEEMSVVERQLPASIRSLIRRRLDSVCDEDLRLLRIASLQGAQFDALVVAEAADCAATEVEERLEALDRVYSLVRSLSERELPDGAITARYQFVHILYQNALQASLKPAGRAVHSAAVARSLEAHHKRLMGPVAARIAMLYEFAREFPQAARAYEIAAEHAAQLVAHREAAALARRGLAALHYLPDKPQRAELELTLLVTLGVALLVTEGYTSQEGRRAYTRARELCLSLGDRPELFPVLWGLWTHDVCAAEHETALELARDLVAMAARGRPQDRVRAAWARGTTALHTGNPVAAVKYFDWGLENYREEDDRIDRHLYGHDAGITCRAFGAWARWWTGQSARAVEEAELTCAAAAKLAHPQSLAFALLIAANVQQACGNIERTLAHATEARGIAEREGLPQFREWSRIQAAWACAQQGRIDEGLAESTDALAALHRLGSQVALPYLLAARAEILATTRPSEAVDVIDDALERVLGTGELQYHAELLRLKAEILAARGDMDAAERLLREAVTVAAAQGSVAIADRAQAALDQLSEPQGTVNQTRRT